MGFPRQCATAEEHDQEEDWAKDFHVGVSLRVGACHDPRRIQQVDWIGRNDPLLPVAGLEASVEYAMQGGSVWIGLAARGYMLLLVHASLQLKLHPFSPGRPFVLIGLGPTMHLPEPSSLAGGYSAALGWMLTRGGSLSGWFAEISVERFDLDLTVWDGEDGTKSELLELTAALLVLGYLW